MTFPRRAGRQQHRANVCADNASDYWRRAQYYTFLDHLLMELRERLVVAQPGFQASHLLPVKVIRNRPTDAMLAEIFEAYRSDQIWFDAATLHCMRGQFAYLCLQNVCNFIKINRCLVR